MGSFNDAKTLFLAAVVKLLVLRKKSGSLLCTLMHPFLRHNLYHALFDTMEGLLSKSGLCGNMFHKASTASSSLALLWLLAHPNGGEVGIISESFRKARIESSMWTKMDAVVCIHTRRSISPKKSNILGKCGKKQSFLRSCVFYK